MKSYVCSNCGNDLIVTNPSAQEGWLIECYHCHQNSNIIVRREKKIADDQSAVANIIEEQPITGKINIFFSSSVGCIALLAGILLFLNNENNGKNKTKNEKIIPSNTVEIATAKTNDATSPLPDRYVQKEKKPSGVRKKTDESEYIVVEDPPKEIQLRFKNDLWLKGLWNEVSKDNVSIISVSAKSATLVFNKTKRVASFEILPRWLTNEIASVYRKQGAKAGNLRSVNGKISDTRTDKRWVTIAGEIYQVLPDSEGFLVQIGVTNPEITTETRKTEESDRRPTQTVTRVRVEPMLIRLLPNGIQAGFTKGQKIKVTGMFVGNFSYATRDGDQNTVPTYDLGIPVDENDQPIQDPNQESRGTPNSNNSSNRPQVKKINSTGTGFFVTSDGHILSSHHVVESAKTVKVFVSGVEYYANIISSDPKNDIAILKASIATPFSWLKITDSDTVKEGEEVGTFGFPLPDLQGSNPKFSKGVISALTGIQDDPTEFQISTPIQPGNSGGPLFLIETGDVIGIISGKLNDSYAFNRSGSMPQNINYAVKSVYVMAFLKSRISVDDVARQQSKRKGVDTIENVKNSIVRIEAFRE